MKTKAEVDQRINELYSQISTSRAGVSELQKEISDLLKLKFDDKGRQIFEQTDHRGLLQG